MSKQDLGSIIGSGRISEVEQIVKKMTTEELILHANTFNNGGYTLIHRACGSLLQNDALKIADLFIPHMTKETILSKVTVDIGTFLDVAVKRSYYKIFSSIPPKMLVTLLKDGHKNESEIYQHDLLNPVLIDRLYNAIHTFDVEISLHPEIADNYFRKGNILYAIGKKEKAIKSYNNAIELDSNYIEKVVFNMKDLLAYSNNKDQIALQFLNNITHPNLDLPIPNIKELIKIKNTQFIEKIGQLKQQSIEITKSLFTVEKDYHVFLQELEGIAFSGEHIENVVNLLGTENIINVHNDSI